MRAGRLMAVTALLLFLLCGAALGEGSMNATVNVRASRDVQDSVIRVGEDVDLLVTLSGFEPAVCQWYFEGEVIEGENQTSLHLKAAQVSDTGLYRLDALDENGRVRVSVDVALRVVDEQIPQTGDSALPTTVPLTAMGACGCVAASLIYRKRRA